MSGGIEDSHRQDRDEFTTSNNGDGASVESEPKGQALADEPKPDEYIAASDIEEEANEEEVPASQPPLASKNAAAPPPPDNGTSNTNTTAASVAQRGITTDTTQGNATAPQGIDLSSLMALITNTITTSMANLEDRIEKKQRAESVKRSAEMAELLALRDQMIQAREQQSRTAHPIDNLHSPVSAATPESKKTFASATSTNSNFSSVKSTPNIPTLDPSTPSSATKTPPVNIFSKPSPNFKTVGTGEQATIIRTVPSSVKYRQLAPMEYESIVNKHRDVIPTPATFYADAPPHEHNILWIKAKAEDITKLRTDDDESDISFAAVGHHFIDSICLFKQYHAVQLYKAF